MLREPGPAVLLGTEATKNVLMKCRLRCRLCSRILTALASLHHSMESGHLRLGLCVVYRPLLEELRQNVAASLTALSGLVLGSLAGYCRPQCSTDRS